MHWIESAGGPLLLLGEQALGNWEGVVGLVSGPPAEVSYSPDGKPTDYDRACSVEGFLGFIAVGTQQGVVLGDEPMRTAWIQFQAASGGMFVRWVFGESETEFLGWISKIPPQLFKPDGAFEAKGRRLLLFDSAVAGRNVNKNPDEFLVVELQPGIYEIDTAIYQPDSRSSMVVHRFCSGVLDQGPLIADVMENETLK